MKVNNVDAPASVLEKELHYNRSYTRQEIAKVLGMSGQDYSYMMQSPHKYATVDIMEKLSILLDWSVDKVFHMCLIRNYSKIDKDKLRIIAAAEKILRTKI